ncbi:MAG: hypothetical protein J3Q66DRAFT_335832 [Benniella sp.]|nr:MAG: hypothetical protein J3Q66DRAFT_335822 [Benniella sp.]KAK3819927.1 MAG: hypothetical protein J3Q66DRAFT_335832 [Benniella sp.]
MKSRSTPKLSAGDQELCALSAIACIFSQGIAQPIQVACGQEQVKHHRHRCRRVQGRTKGSKCSVRGLPFPQDSVSNSNTLTITSQVSQQELPHDRSYSFTLSILKNDQAFKLLLTAIMCCHVRQQCLCFLLHGTRPTHLRYCWMLDAGCWMVFLSIVFSQDRTNAY